MKDKLKLWLFGTTSLLGLILFVLFVGNIISIAVEFQTLCLVGSMFLLCGGLSGIVSSYIKSKKPKFYDKMFIEQNDERNDFIKNKAGRKAGEIASYMNIVFLLILSLFAKSLPFWVIMCQACVTVSYPILSGVFFSKYYKE